VSDIPLEALYNDQVEFIRANELATRQKPQDIVFKIQDSFEDAANIKKITFTSPSLHKPFSMKLDINNRQTCFESNFEKTKRKELYLNEGKKELMLSDFIN
jgi:hypothetical protein